MTAEEIRITMLNDEDIDMLSELVLYDWPSAKPDVQRDLQPYWAFRDEISITDSTSIKGKRIYYKARH